MSNHPIFRAWHTKLNEYVRLDKFCVLAEDGIHSTDCVLEQYTGINDRNGEKIFVGDLVRLRGGKKPRGGERPFYITEVVFRNGMYTVKSNKSVLVDSAVLSMCTVVGNVHAGTDIDVGTTIDPN